MMHLILQGLVTVGLILLVGGPPKRGHGVDHGLLGDTPSQNDPFSPEMVDLIAFTNICPADSVIDLLSV